MAAKKEVPAFSNLNVGGKEDNFKAFLSHLDLRQDELGNRKEG